jgi:hypothetical protein
MADHMNDPKSLGEDKGKGKKYRDQFRRTYEGFFKQPQTMKELSMKLNIDRANICRYCRRMRLQNLIRSYKKGRCSITRRIVNIWTTNPDLFPQDPQLSLFNSEES